jgi:hypothetical protein
MTLSDREIQFLTTLAREHNRTGCRGPAHDLLRRHVYPNAPRSGPGSLAFAYEAVPLFGVLLRGFTDLESIDEFLHRTEPRIEPDWPWSSAEEYLNRLADARNESIRPDPPLTSAAR